MDIVELVKKINQCIENLDLVSARRYIEGNLESLNQNKHLLRGNARSLLEFITKRTDAGIIPLNRREMNVIYSINSYASKFDLRGLKLSIKNNANLLMREDVKQYLNEDAKTLLEGFNAIRKVE
ncbi:hypothetical protein ACIQYS_09850 [Psychrobacillus sp. NPDC096426]|uniref:hypothetical protein n=1 Tax=Psychrobacillus sp. NPDC096426 TaxID=3364491 RepID=UPI003826F066